VVAANQHLICLGSTDTPTGACRFARDLRFRPPNRLALFVERIKYVGLTTFGLTRYVPSRESDHGLNASRQFDPSMMTGCCGKTTVAREQRSVERFGKGDVDGVIGRKIVP
jgi:hypothetical protein